MVCQHLIDVCHANRQSRAHSRTAILVSRAAIVAGVDLHHGTAAYAAAKDSAEQSARRASWTSSAAFLAWRPHALTCGVPQGVFENSQIIALFDLPFTSRPCEPSAPSCIRVLCPPAAI